MKGFLENLPYEIHQYHIFKNASNETVFNLARTYNSCVYTALIEFLYRGDRAKTYLSSLLWYVIDLFPKQTPTPYQRSLLKAALTYYCLGCHRENPVDYMGAIGLLLLLTADEIVHTNNDAYRDQLRDRAKHWFLILEVTGNDSFLDKDKLSGCTASCYYVIPNYICYKFRQFFVKDTAFELEKVLESEWPDFFEQLVPELASLGNSLSIVTNILNELPTQKAGIPQLIEVLFSDLVEKRFTNNPETIRNKQRMLDYYLNWVGQYPETFEAQLQKHILSHQDTKLRLCQPLIWYCVAKTLDALNRYHQDRAQTKEIQAQVVQLVEVLLKVRCYNRYEVLWLFEGALDARQKQSLIDTFLSQLKVTKRPIIHSHINADSPISLLKTLLATHALTSEQLETLSETLDQLTQTNLISTETHIVLTQQFVAHIYTEDQQKRYLKRFVAHNAYPHLIAYVEAVDHTNGFEYILDHLALYADLKFLQKELELLLKMLKRLHPNTQVAQKALNRIEQVAYRTGEAPGPHLTKTWLVSQIPQGLLELADLSPEWRQVLLPNRLIENVYALVNQGESNYELTICRALGRFALRHQLHRLDNEALEQIESQTMIPLKERGELALMWLVRLSCLLTLCQNKREGAPASQKLISEYGQEYKASLNALIPFLIEKGGHDALDQLWAQMIRLTSATQALWYQTVCQYIENESLPLHRLVLVLPKTILACVEKGKLAPGKLTKPLMVNFFKNTRCPKNRALIIEFLTDLFSIHPGIHIIHTNAFKMFLRLIPLLEDRFIHYGSVKAAFRRILSQGQRDELFQCIRYLNQIRQKHLSSNGVFCDLVVDVLSYTAEHHHTAKLSDQTQSAIQALCQYLLGTWTSGMARGRVLTIAHRMLSHAHFESLIEQVCHGKDDLDRYHQLTHDIEKIFEQPPVNERWQSLSLDL